LFLALNRRLLRVLAKITTVTLFNSIHKKLLDWLAGCAKKILILSNSPIADSKAAQKHFEKHF
jgi:hypothetical protein